MVENGGLARIILGFTAVIIGLTFFISIADTTGSLTNTFIQTNASFTASNNTAVVFTTAGQNVTAITAVRAGAIVLVSPSNFTSSIAAATITMTINYSANINTTTETWNVDYNYNSNDFIADGAARSITSLIPLFFALAIMAASLIFVDFRDFGFK